MDSKLLKYLYSQTNELLSNQGERFNQNFDKADKIIIWIVGFAIGILVILFSKEPDNVLIKELSSSIIIYSLLIVILGLFFRIISFFTQMKMNNIIINLIMFSKGYTSPPDLPTPRIIKDSDNTNDIIEYLKKDFEIEYTPLNLKNLTTEQLKKSREDFFKFYDYLSKSNDLNFQMNEFTTNIGKRFGYSKKAINRKVKSQNNERINGIIYRILLNLSYILFFLTIGIFILGTFKILIKMIELNCS